MKQGEHFKSEFTQSAMIWQFLNWYKNKKKNQTGKVKNNNLNGRNKVKFFQEMKTTVNPR